MKTLLLHEKNSYRLKFQIPGTKPFSLTGNNGKKWIARSFIQLNIWKKKKELKFIQDLSQEFYLKYINREFCKEKLLST